MGFPLMVRAIRLSIEAVDTRLEAASSTLGANAAWVFLTVTLPLTLPGIIAGMVLCFAKAMGEFGATITFVSNIPGETRTIATAIYTNTQTPAGDAAAMRLTIVAIVIVSMNADTGSGTPDRSDAHTDASSGAAALGGAGYGLLAGSCFAGFSLIFAGIEAPGTLWLLSGLRLASVSALIAVFLVSRLVGRRPPGAEPIKPGAIPSGLRGRAALIGLLAAAGSGDTLGNLFFFLSAQQSGVAVAAVFTSIAPVTTVLFAALILRESINRRQAIGIALAAVATIAIALGGIA